MADYINENYVSLKVNGQEGIGAEYKKQFNVIAYPTVLLLEADGKEIERLFGWRNEPEQYFQTLVDYTNGVNTIAGLLAAYAGQPDNVEQNYLIAQRRMERGERSLTRTYYEKILVLDPENRSGYHGEALETLAVLDLYEKGDERPLQARISGSRDPAELRRGYDILIRYYNSTHAPDLLLAAYDSALARLPDDTQLLNGYAWYIYEQKLSDRYAHALTSAEKAVTIDPDKAHIWDTLAWLEYETGQTDKAITHMQKAAQLDPDRAYYTDNLEKMRQPQHR